LVGRRGKKKALVAVGHKIIIAVYHVLNTKQTYKEPTLKVSPKKQNKQVLNYVNKLKKLGVDIQLDKDKMVVFLLMLRTSIMKLTKSAFSRHIV
jgi:hypothetical protein